MPLATYRNLPPIQTGYPLDDVWSVVVPIARTNLITNPSFEVATTSWTAIGGSIARSTTQQYHGAYSLAVTPTATTTDGVRYDTVSLTSGTSYAYSAKLRGVAGLKYSLGIETTCSVALATTTFTASGRWQWITGYYAETSTTTRRLVARKAGHASVAIFYIDGAQVEAIVTGELVSTYIDGDQLGLVPNQTPAVYFWNGTPHASTSMRSGLTRAGGMVIPFKKYGFLLTAIIGLGLAQPQNVATDYARIDGSYDDYTRHPARQFTLTGRFQGRTYRELRSNRSALAQLFDRDLIGQDQRMTLLRHVTDYNGNITTTTARLPVKYESGFSGNTDNQAAETVPITFTHYLPLIGSDGESGSALTVQLSISNGLRVLQQSSAGLWGNLSTGANANVWSLFYASDGKLYAGGEFTSIGGVAANRIAYWDGTAWNAMGTGMAGVGKAVYSIVEGPDGSIYAAGDGSDFGGVANTARLGKWSAGAWSSITAAGSANSDMFKLVFGPSGILYAAGDFSTINGVAAVRVAQRSTAGVWTALAGGSTQIVYAMVYSNGRLYLAGDTTGAGVYTVSYWNGSAWTTTGSASPANIIRAMDVGKNGVIYIGGQFTTMGGVAASLVAQFNGTSWVPMGTGITGTDVSVMKVISDGTVLTGGGFTAANGITTLQNIVRWNGSSWVLVDVDIAWSTVRAIATRADGTTAIGGTGATSTGVASALTTVTNPGTAKSYPTVTIKGPTSGTSRIYQMTNETTGRNIYFNYTINAGETARLVFQPDNLSFTSDFQGNIAGTIMPGSNEADFFLQPGANSIGFFSADSTVVTSLYFRPNYASLDDVP